MQAQVQDLRRRVTLRLWTCDSRHRFWEGFSLGDCGHLNSGAGLRGVTMKTVDMRSRCHF